MVLSLFIILGVAAIIWLLADESRQTELDKIMTILKDMTPSAEFSWLHHANSILKLEVEIKCKDIWIVSPHLLNDTGSTYSGGKHGVSTITTVEKNLKRKVTYTFIIPDTEIMEERLSHLYRNHVPYGKQLRVIKLPQATFQSLGLAISELVIYNPNMEAGHRPQVFMQLPVVDSYKYWIEIDDHEAFDVVARVRKVVEENVAT